MESLLALVKFSYDDPGALPQAGMHATPLAPQAMNPRRLGDYQRSTLN